MIKPVSYVQSKHIEDNRNAETKDRDYDFAFKVAELAVKALPLTAEAGAHAAKAEELWQWITTESPKATP